MYGQVAADSESEVNIKASLLSTCRININAKYKAAWQAQVQQAEKMKSAFIWHYKYAEIGDSVMIAIPMVDQGSGEFPITKVVIIGKEDNGFTNWELKMFSS